MIRRQWLSWEHIFRSGRRKSKFDLAYPPGSSMPLSVVCIVIIFRFSEQWENSPIGHWLRPCQGNEKSPNSALRAFHFNRQIRSKIIIETTMAHDVAHSCTIFPCYLGKEWSQISENEGCIWFETLIFRNTHRSSKYMYLRAKYTKYKMATTKFYIWRHIICDLPIPILSW